MLFISEAVAQTAPATQQQPGLFDALWPLIPIFIIFYFLLIRPQMKRQKEHRQMVSALQKGDEAVTSGGIAGKIVNVGENYIDLEIADNTVVKVTREAVNTVLPKGSLKNM